MGVKCASCGVENEGWVPKERLAEVAGQRKAAEEAAAVAQAALQEAEEKAGKAVKSAEKAEAALGELQAKTSQLTLEKSAYKAGLTDDEGVQVAALLWGQVPEDSRPEGGFAEWLQDAPRAVKAYMATEAPPPAQDGPSEPERQAVAIPNTEASARDAKPIAYTAERVASMTIDEYKEYRRQKYG